MKNSASLFPDEILSSSQAPSFMSAFRFWLKLGFISFGGPAGQIAIMHQEIVDCRHWISERHFLHALNFCMVLPGPEAQQLATYIGWLMHGIRGGIVAGVLFVLPSLVILIALSWIYIAFGDIPLITALLYGIKPAVTAIVAHAAYRIGSRVLKNAALWGIAIIAFAAIFLFNVPFPAIVLMAALLGAVGGKIAPYQFQAAPPTHSTDNSPGASGYENEIIATEHIRFRWMRLIRIAVIGLSLWLAPMLLLLNSYGWSGMPTQIGWFFTKAALLTLGGAYAVLPYIYQGAVEHYGWLSSTQLIDGLALGETTPGPLIMLVAFVGFVGAYLQSLFGADLLFWSGAFGAVLATWFTFLPSFVFIFVGGPLIELTHNELKFTAPLTAITSAVVGVIVNLLLFFAYRVFWPGGFQGAFDWASAAIALSAAILLFYYRRNVIEVIVTSIVLGLMWKVLIPLL
ncbi:MAG: chromate efflux transporter [Methylobacter sp.]